MLGALIGFIITAILAGVGGFFIYQKFTTGSPFGANQPVGGPSGSVPNGSGGNCAPAAGETAFSGKVVYINQSQQYTLQSAGGTTYYLRLNQTTEAVQSSTLQNKLGKEAQVNGKLATPTSNDVNVYTVCP